MTAPDDKDLHDFLNDALAPYSNLAALKPKSWPFKKISIRQMNDYFAKRAGYHVINLPLLLYNTQLSGHNEVREIFAAILKKLDEFVVAYIQKGIPKAKDIIDPVWTDIWDLHNSRIFNIAAEVYFTDYLEKTGFQILEFEKKYSDKDNKSADIFTSFKGTPFYIDVKNPLIEVSFPNKSDLRNKIEADANRYFNSEFEHLPSDSYGMIALIYRAFGGAEPMFQPHVSTFDTVLNPNANEARKFANIYWFKQVSNNLGRDLMIFSKTTNL